MEIISEHQMSPTPIVMDALSEDRKRRPSGADAAHNSLLQELNRWSRDNDWPSTLNSWIAEEAVRRAF
jgi:hypothetical protein